jgi:hypothetical protein
MKAKVANNVKQVAHKEGYDHDLQNHFQSFKHVFKRDELNYFGMIMVNIVSHFWVYALILNFFKMENFKLTQDKIWIYMLE